MCSSQHTVLVVGLSVFISSSGLHVIPAQVIQLPAFITWLALFSFMLPIKKERRYTEYLKTNYGEEEGYVALLPAMECKKG